MGAGPPARMHVRPAGKAHSRGLGWAAAEWIVLRCWSRSERHPFFPAGEYKGVVESFPDAIGVNAAVCTDQQTVVRHLLGTCRRLLPAEDRLSAATQPAAAHTAGPARSTTPIPAHSHPTSAAASCHHRSGTTATVHGAGCGTSCRRRTARSTTLRTRRMGWQRWSVRRCRSFLTSERGLVAAWAGSTAAPARLPARPPRPCCASSPAQALAGLGAAWRNRRKKKLNRHGVCGPGWASTRLTCLWWM